MDSSASPIATAWERFASGDDAVEGVRPQILLSWKRCRDDYGVDPGRDRAITEPVPPPPAPAETIIAAELGAAAMSLVGDVSAIGGIVAIADRHGRVLGAWGDPTALRRGREQNLDPMFIWREGTIGTTGLGTALESGAAVAVDRHEHWCSALQNWTCAAAGVRDPLGGAALGAIDISARERSLPPTALDALTRAVAAIEKRLHEHAHRSRRALAAAYWSHGGSPGVAVLDRGGRIVQAGDTARAALGVADPNLRRVARAVAERAAGDRGWFGTAELQSGETATVEPVEDADRVIGVLVRLDAPDKRPIVAGARSDGMLDDRVVGMLGRRMLVVPAERLRLAEVMDGRVWLDGDDGRLRAAARGLDELEARLTPHGFLRVNRQTLVNLRKISELAPSFNRGLWVRVEGSDQHIAVSRRRVGALRAQLGL